MSNPAEHGSSHSSEEDSGKVNAKSFLAGGIRKYRLEVLGAIEADIELQRSGMAFEVWGKADLEFQLLLNRLSKIKVEYATSESYLEDILKRIKAAIYFLENAHSTARLVINKEVFDRAVSEISQVSVMSIEHAQNQTDTFTAQSSTIKESLAKVVRAKFLKRETAAKEKDAFIRVHYRQFIEGILNQAENDFMLSQVPLSEQAQARDEIEDVFGELRFELQYRNDSFLVPTSLRAELLEMLKDVFGYGESRTGEGNQVLINDQVKRDFEYRVRKISLEEANQVVEAEEAVQEKRVAGTDFSLN